jgi:Ion channel
MSEVKSPHSRAAQGGSSQPALTTRLMLRDSLTARRAAPVIAGVTVVVTAGGGILERLLDHQEYPTLGKGLWFSLQTVSTVGYGDATPERAVGRSRHRRRGDADGDWLRGGDHCIGDGIAGRERPATIRCGF